ncbi:hypothetical protein [Sporolituus thermophilus]|uniref:Uncharacterized protein n=1 Tax=Sporolituus thermophilus DSM 23256 TaxID=1123285 RepID=A0A1G7LBQ9_9FIRM|nr:hypothetical protein [Sporolituus thermophilus]SDF46480.1 hypothetical protein SAMN05660235_01698 [Sporolituus thermophilus DSM 23256]
MGLEAIRQKPRSQVVARGLAVIGFLALTAMAYVQANYIIAALFTLPAVYYWRKLVKSSPSDRCRAERPAAPVDVDIVKSELREMQAYYRRLKKGWLWVGILGWGCTALLALAAPSIFLIVVVGLAGYASYAYMRCRSAIKLIETGLGKGG